MERRYELFAHSGTRNIEGYNDYIKEHNSQSEAKQPELPYIVVIVDELADLMMVASSDVEDAIMRLAQMARAAGIHLIIATQRPSVDVITVLLKQIFHHVLHSLYLLKQILVQFLTVVVQRSY